MENEILKKNILTKQDFVGMLLDELSNSVYFEDKADEDIKLIREKSNFDLIQKYCTRDIKTIINQMKDFENFELNEFEYWFGLKVKEYINEIIKQKKDNMKSIDEIWKELINHPEYMTGSIWTIESVAQVIETDIEDDEDFDLLGMSIKDYTKEIVTKNKTKFIDIIDDFEAYCYKHDSWSSKLDYYGIELK
ncbi:hypothetical protein [Flavobacterium sp.]|uniref:hypothetical protein n=1 Tax=Flavobacterium sp. TaxID=239 RepID=UPI00286F196E|nr:hypothetical protein [Flavobacterium sp.]